MLQSSATTTNTASTVTTATPSIPVKRRKVYDVAQNTDMLAKEHDMQMEVWRSQLEKDKLWKEEHELSMCILRKQYEILCKTGIAAHCGFNDAMF